MEISSNQRVAGSRKQLGDMPHDAIEQLSACLLFELGESDNKIEQEALDALSAGDYDAAKRYCLYDPCNSYLAAISCIASAYRSPMVADSVLRDASRHTADLVRQRCEARIASQFQAILCS
jgi:hypothetical protein